MSKVTKLVFVGATAAVAATYVAMKRKPEQAKAVVDQVKQQATDPSGLFQRGKERVATAAVAGKAKLGRDNSVADSAGPGFVVTSDLSTPATPSEQGPITDAPTS